MNSGDPRKCSIRKKVRKYYVRLPGSRKAVPLCANKAAAETMAAQLLARKDEVAAGIDPGREREQRPLAEWLADWARHLRGLGSCPQHCARAPQRVQAVLDGSGAVMPGDLDLDAILHVLTTMQESPEIPVLPGGDWFTPAELGAVLGVKPASVAPRCRQHHLPGKGGGPSRLYPRATAEALIAMRSRGRCASTVNLYVANVKTFCTWLAKKIGLSASPLAGLTARQVSETRHARRALSAAELVAVLDATRANLSVFRCLTGTDRYYLYLTAMSTGLRSSELATVSPSAFTSDCSTVTVAGAYTKNGQLACQPLPADVAAQLVAYIAGRPPSVQLWPGTWHLVSALMFRADVEAAGLPYAVETPAGPRFADFHCLRHSYITLLIRSGADVGVVQRLARHSSPILTLKLYTHTTADESAAAVQNAFDRKLTNAGERRCACSCLSPPIVAK